MFINSLSYQNKQTGWTLEKLELDRFNLLVGASGVGKTQILRALRSIQALALSGQPKSPISFDIDFQHQDDSFRWEFESASTALSAEGALIAANSFSVVREKLTSSTGHVLFERDQEEFLFKGQKLPQLSRTSVALRLLEDKSITKAVIGLVIGVLDDHPYQAATLLDSEADLRALLTLTKNSSHQTGLSMLPPQVKAWVLKAQLPEQFESIKDVFREIFPSVEDVSVEVESERATTNAQGNQPQLSFKLKEYGIAHWVQAESISSGMVRTLIHLVDLTVALKDSVVLIDEFENSLGVNCMGPLTDFIQSRASELQFIITSHHPYIINKIPKAHWKVVRRHGSTVRVTPARDIRALQGSSAQDDFTRLLNAPEFEEGMP